MADDYHLWEKKGRRLQKWIENYRASGCPYPISTFTFNVQTPGLYRRSNICAYRSKTTNCCQPEQCEFHLSTGQHRLRDEGPPVWWIGRTGPGVIFIDDVFRSKRSDDPYISEFTKAAYQMDFPLDSLRNVIVPNVDEVNTLSCLRKVYKSQGLHYPSSTEQPWEPSLPEFNALLGTGIGKIVAAFVLCAWGQGRKRIARIVTSHIGADVHKLYMRFDLEDM